jgi:phytoene synthase
MKSRAQIVHESRKVLEQKARSFRWAAQFLAPDTHDDAAILYAFCRLVDDTADEATSVDEAHGGLWSLEAQLMGEVQPEPFMGLFLEMSDRVGLDLAVARELIIGVRSDLDEVIVADDVELLRYCYRVAGTVGLMMCSVLGVEQQEAYPFAVDLGVGMQLTNICRDVAEDAGMGRIYVPKTRLLREGITTEALLEREVDRKALSRVVGDLLSMADWYYASADEGLSYIPSRSRFAILVASRVYRAIGVQLMANGADPLNGRTIVHWRDKTRWVAHAMRKFASPQMLGLVDPGKHDGQLHLPLSGLPGAAPRSSF